MWSPSLIVAFLMGLGTIVLTLVGCKKQRGCRRLARSTGPPTERTTSVGKSNVAASKSKKPAGNEDKSSKSHKTKKPHGTAVVYQDRLTDGTASQKSVKSRVGAPALGKSERSMRAENSQRSRSSRRKRSTHDELRRSIRSRRSSASRSVDDSEKPNSSPFGTTGSESRVRKRRCARGGDTKTAEGGDSRRSRRSKRGVEKSVELTKEQWKLSAPLESGKFQVPATKVNEGDSSKRSSLRKRSSSTSVKKETPSKKRLPSKSVKKEESKSNEKKSSQASKLSTKGEKSKVSEPKNVKKKKSVAVMERSKSITDKKDKLKAKAKESKSKTESLSKEKMNEKSNRL